MIKYIDIADIACGFHAGTIYDAEDVSDGQENAMSRLPHA
jgi:hypothetical protein